MFRVLIRLGFIILVFNQLLPPCSALGSKSKASRGYEDPARPKTLAGSSLGLPNQNTTRRGLGLSAWGIVALAVGFIMAAMGCYYFSICYPLCPNHSVTHKYDKMTLPSNLAQQKLGGYKAREADATIV